MKLLNTALLLLKRKRKEKRNMRREKEKKGKEKSADKFAASLILTCMSLY